MPIKINVSYTPDEEAKIPRLCRCCVGEEMNASPTRPTPYKYYKIRCL